MTTIVLDDDSNQERVLIRALEFYRGHLETHQSMLHNYRLADDTVSAISMELREIDGLLSDIRG